MKSVLNNNKMDRNTVVQLRQIAKERGLRGYSKLRKAELIEFLNQSRLERENLLDAPIPKHEIPKSQKILSPSKPAKLVKKIEKAVDDGKRVVEDWGQWLKEMDASRVVVDDKLKDFKARIAELYKERDQPIFTLVESKTSLKQFSKHYTIDGVKGYGVLDFLQAVKPIVINFLQTQKNIKIEFVLRCNMSKTNIATGETTVKSAYFNSFVEIVFQETDREEIYQRGVDKMRESLQEREVDGFSIRLRV